jgi:hypothetical protein
MVGAGGPCVRGARGEGRKGGCAPRRPGPEGPTAGARGVARRCHAAGARGRRVHAKEFQVALFDRL